MTGKRKTIFGMQRICVGRGGDGRSRETFRVNGIFKLK